MNCFYLPGNLYLKIELRDDPHAILDLTGLAHVLTKRELLAIRMLFQFQYNIPEIASAWGVKKQTVCRTRDRALKKIKQWFEIEQAV